MGTASPPHQKLETDPTIKVDEDKLKKQKEIDDLASNHFFKKRKMVICCIPQCHCYGWGPGVVILILSWVVTLYILWQMVEMHEMVPGKRFDWYHELGQHAFGEKLGLYIVVPQQLIVEVGVDIVYMVTGGKSLEKIYHLVCDKPCKHIKTTYFIMIFASVHFVLAHLPNFNSISGVSLAAAVMSLTHSTIAWIASVHKGVQPDVQYGYKAPTPSGTILNFFTALGNVAFAYAGHIVVLEIQATIPSTPEKPSKGPILMFRWLNKYTVFTLVFLSFFWKMQLYAMPVFNMIETVLVKKWHFRPTQTLRFFILNFYVAATMYVAITFPFFGGLLGFFGGFAFAPTTYFCNFSFLASCGLLYTNQRGSVYLGYKLGILLTYNILKFYICNHTGPPANDSITHGAIGWQWGRPTTVA
ncbi:Lysine histidine transporter 1 [Hibiscus syriacus]|uniref:Lysine histidine transporter 1 n=1 Tax=Hibiscus syriacus TaxID=106335 RepID=A0A6A2ZKB1_HIBSY|nr:Lysine histidine transporter 1 [Hibiscus syriacus]